MAAWYQAVDTSKKQRLYTRRFSVSGNEYIYLTGVASTAAYSVVTFDEVGVTALITANAVGDVAVAQAAVDATTKYGWYLIYGTGTAKCDTIADNKACFIDGTDGRVDDAVVTGDLIVGMYSRSADSSNTCTVQVSYPKVTDILG
jgi:hypothetical protein